MDKFHKIIIDTKGTDKGPLEIISGVAAALEAHKSLAVLLVGNEEIIKKEAEKLGMPMERVEILDAPGEITNYDNPADAVFRKTDSSMIKALAKLAEDGELCGMISGGNTGAFIAGSIRYLSRPDRTRPALAAIFPSVQGGYTCLVDTGATVDCTPQMLLQFARLGCEFMRDSYKIESPRVALLSNGSEATKGNKLVKETHGLLLDAEDINFVGNIEGCNAFSGDCDVLVCDGFAGNQVLKTTEGTAKRIITDVVKYAKKTENPEIMKLVGHLMSLYDISSLGGGIILGSRKPLIKIRGSSGKDAIVNTAEMLINIAENREAFNKKKNNM
jgi:glycerol-3-phosphate acyltransferase PlsX